MSLAPRLDLRQSQSLVMTPQLQQAIKLLALSNLEIETFIAEELEKNPLLDAHPAGGDDAPDAAPEPEPDFETPRRPGRCERIAGGRRRGGGRGRARRRFGRGDLPSRQPHRFDRRAGRQPRAWRRGRRRSEDGPDFDNFADPTLSLADHLMAQAGATSTAPTCSSPRI
jgi:RNA polymerase sigma-54 factor